MSYRAQPGILPWERTTNPLLLKDDVGRGKPSAYSLPQGNFIYGKPLPRDEEGAKEVTSLWNFHTNTRDREPERDFKKLNKISVAQGVFKASQQSNFRRTNDARVIVKKGQNALPLLIPEEEFRYGRPNRPSTPMKLVMGNCYGLEQEQALLDYYQQRSATSHSNRPRLLPRGNKASVLSYQFNKTRQEEIQRRGSNDYFKLTKFKNVHPKTNTFAISQRSKWNPQKGENSGAGADGETQNNEQQLERELVGNE